MLWAHLKISLSLIIPLGAMLYAHDLRYQADCQRIEQIVHSASNVQWSLAHPHQALQRNREETQYLHRLTQDLDS